VLLRLEGAVHRHHERVVGERHDVSFRKNLVNLQPDGKVYFPERSSLFIWVVCDGWEETNLSNIQQHLY
jgi:hypothetical protein